MFEKPQRFKPYIHKGRSEQSNSFIDNHFIFNYFRGLLILKEIEFRPSDFSTGTAARSWDINSEVGVPLFGVLILVFAGHSELEGLHAAADVKATDTLRNASFIRVGSRSVAKISNVTFVSATDKDKRLTKYSRTGPSNGAIIDAMSDAAVNVFLRNLDANSLVHDYLLFLNTH